MEETERDLILLHLDLIAQELEQLTRVFETHNLGGVAFVEHAPIQYMLKCMTASTSAIRDLVTPESRLLSMVIERKGEDHANYSGNKSQSK